jgi:transposase
MCTPGRWLGMRLMRAPARCGSSCCMPTYPAFWGWLESLPQPVKVTYEAGPTGYGLARFLRGRGVECPVAAPSKLIRPAGNRVKTDAKDAEHLCRLLRLDEIVQVIVPDPEQEAARDLVRAREAVRGDLMRARHRVSKLLLRQRPFAGRGARASRPAVAGDSEPTSETAPGAARCSRTVWIDDTGLTWTDS